jgi:NAD(P)-dependent dehydrogenase (short-subunit alcohol dehydrogenase family)
MQMLDGDVVLIVGGGSGLGLGLARHFISEGAQIAIFEISETKIVALKQEFGDSVLLFQGDVTSIDDLIACREAIVNRWGRLTALIGSQGIFDGQVPLRDIAIDRVTSLFDELFHINVLGYILACKVFVDLLEESDGAIVLTSSVAAYAADGGGLMYTASKGAVVAAVKQLALEFSPRVRVNGVAPGAFSDSQLRGPASLGLQNHNQSDIPKDVFAQTVRNLTLMQKVPTPVEYAPMYAFLASRHNTVSTGQTFVLEQGSLNRATLSGPGGGGGIGI